MPDGYVEIPHAPPPPPSSIEDVDIMDLSLELNAASMDDVPGDLDEHGIERVPMADPGLDVRHLYAAQIVWGYDCIHSDLFPTLVEIIRQLAKGCIHAGKAFSQVRFRFFSSSRIQRRHV